MICNMNLAFCTHDPWEGQAAEQFYFFGKFLSIVVEINHFSELVPEICWSPIFLCPYVVVIHNSIVATMNNISFLSKNLHAHPNFSLTLNTHTLISACLPTANDFTHAEDCGNT